MVYEPESTIKVFKNLLQKTLLAVSDDKVKAIEADGGEVPKTKPTLDREDKTVVPKIHASTTELDYAKVMSFFKYILTKNPMDNIDQK